jgi:hypothetical protein
VVCEVEVPLAEFGGQQLLRGPGSQPDLVPTYHGPRRDPPLDIAGLNGVRILDRHIWPAVRKRIDRNAVDLRSAQRIGDRVDAPQRRSAQR